MPRRPQPPAAPPDPSAATRERIAHIRQLLAFDAHEALFGAMTANDMVRLCAWQLLAEGQWQEAGRMAERLAPYEHERLPTVTIVHQSPAETGETIDHDGALAAPRDRRAPPIPAAGLSERLNEPPPGTPTPPAPPPRRLRLVPRDT